MDVPLLREEETRAAAATDAHELDAISPEITSFHPDISFGPVPSSVLPSAAAGTAGFRRRGSHRDNSSVPSGGTSLSLLLNSL